MSVCQSVNSQSVYQSVSVSVSQSNSVSVSQCISQLVSHTIPDGPTMPREYPPGGIVKEILLRIGLFAVSAMEETEEVEG